jgi:hypothetical protein
MARIAREYLERGDTGPSAMDRCLREFAVRLRHLPNLN